MAKPKLCCMMNPTGQCSLCGMILCPHHVLKIEDGYGSYQLKCSSPKCNDSIYPRWSRSFRVKDLSAGEALLRKITSQKVKRTKRKILSKAQEDE